MTTPIINKMTPIVASHLSKSKLNTKIAIDKPKTITDINAITIPTPPFFLQSEKHIGYAVTSEHNRYNLP